MKRMNIGKHGRVASASAWLRCAVALFILSVSSIAMGQQRPTFRSSVEIVRLPVTVFAQDGGPVGDLEARDFTVLENGVERPVPIVLGPDEGPLEVAVVMDASGSMSNWPSRDLFHALLDNLDPGSCVLLIPFEQEIGRGVWGSPEDRVLRQMIDEITQYGSDEAAYDAVIAAFGFLRDRAAGVTHGTRPAPMSFSQLSRLRQPHRSLTRMPRPRGDCTPEVESGASSETGVRQAVVFVTDEPDSASQARLDDVLLAAWGSGIPIFSLAVTPLREDTTPSIRNRRGNYYTDREVLEPLQRLTRYTGGFVLHATSGRWDRWRDKFVMTGLRGLPTPIEGIRRLGQSLRGHYLLGYVPSRSAETDTWPLVRSEIEVRVGRDDLEVRTVDEIARGMARSEGAAMDVALRGFQELTNGQAREALQSFDAATSLAPDLGLTHYGRGLALTKLEHYVDALTAFEQARSGAPWLPDIDAWMAIAQLHTGDIESAWENALRAYYRGANVDWLIEDLQVVAPRTIDLSKPPVHPRVRVVGQQRGGLAAMLAAPELISTTMTMVEESGQLESAWNPSSSDLVLLVLVDEGEVRGPWVSVSGRLILEDPAGKRWAAERFRIRDARDSGSVSAALTPAFEKLEEEIRKLHADSE